MSEQATSPTGTPSEGVSRTSRLCVFWICVGLVASVAAVYWPVVRFEFVPCDDPEYMLNNAHVQAGLTWQGVVWAFTSGYASNWHPLTWLSYMLDCQLFGLNPGVEHTINALFHTVNTVLVFLVLLRMTRATWPSAFVAALFGLHPLHVESVAWVSERKDVLSAFFFMLTLWAYALYVETLEPGNDATQPTAAAKQERGIARTRNWYALSIAFFVLGLMSKPMLVTMPFVLLLLDYWPLERWPGADRKAKRRMLVEKLPFAMLSAVSCTVTFLVQERWGAMAALNVIRPDMRVENALLAYVLYLKKMVWPTRLVALYPFNTSIGPETGIAAAVALVAISALIYVGSRRRPYLAMGWLWYVITLVPVIGLVQVGPQAMADRYTYIPLIGVFVAIVWYVEEVSRGWRFQRPAMACAGAGVLATCVALTGPQVRRWKDGESILKYTLTEGKNSSLAQLNLGTALMWKRQFSEAAEHFAEALRLQPEYAEAMSNLGYAKQIAGKFDEAIELYRSALAIKPNIGQTHYLLGSALVTQGKRAEAMEEYRRAVEANPNDPMPLNDLAWLLATAPEDGLRDGAEAVKLAEHACAVTKSGNAQLIGTLAAAYAEAGRFDDAVRTGEKAKSVAAAGGWKSGVNRNEELLQLYRAGKPCREGSDGH